MTRSPGHGGFFVSVMGSLRFFEASCGPLEGRLQHSARDYTADMQCGHGVTSDFKVCSRGHSRILVDINCVPGLGRKYSAYGSDHCSVS